MMPSISKGLQRPKYQIILLIIFAGLFWLGLSTGVITSLFVLRELHASPAQLSLLVSIGTILGLVIDTPASAMADKWSRRLMLIASIVIGCIGQLIGALSQNYAMFLVASVFLSVRAALRSGVVEAMIYDYIQIGGYRERYHYIMSRFGIMALVGSTVAPFLGGIVVAQLGVHTAFWFDLVPMVASLILLLVMREPGRHYARSELRLDKHMAEAASITFRSPVLTYYFVFNLLLWTYATTFNSYSSLYFGQAFLIGALTAVFDREKQLVLPSHLRSTLLSGFGVSAQLLFLPLSFAFGALADRSVALAFLFVGGAVLVGLSLIAFWHRRFLAKTDIEPA